MTSPPRTPQQTQRDKNTPGTKPNQIRRLRFWAQGNDLHKFSRGCFQIARCSDPLDDAYDATRSGFFALLRLDLGQAHATQRARKSKFFIWSVVLQICLPSDAGKSRVDSASCLECSCLSASAEGCEAERSRVVALRDNPRLPSITRQADL